MKLRGRGGQGVVETLLCLPLLLLFISALGILGYRAVVFHMATYHLHEALICEAESSINNCKKELEARLKKILIGKQNVKISFSKSRSKVQGRLEIPLQPPLQVEQVFSRKL